MKYLSRTLVRSPFAFGVCTSAAAFRKECRRIKDRSGDPWLRPGDAASCHIWSAGGITTRCIICLPPRGKTPRAEYAALLVHEATHIWQRVRDSIDRNASDEFEAYSLQSICQELFESVGL